MFLTVFISCSKDVEQEVLNSAPNSFVVNIDVISATQANLTWESAIDPEGDAIRYSLEVKGLTIDNSLLNDRALLLNNLTPSTEYQGKVTAIDSKFNITVSNFNFITKSIPQIETLDITSLNLFSVDLSGKLISKGSSEIIEIGFVISTTKLPNIENNLKKIEQNLDTQNKFGTTLTNITPNTTYYLRTYGINNDGIGYGNEIEFTTLDGTNIYNGNISLSTQEEVIAFGKNKYTTINGSLNLTGTVSDLSPLESLAIVNNNFTVKNTINLKNFEGLNNLKVTGNLFANGFRIENNIALESFSGLNNLLITRGEADIINNDKLINFEGLNSYSAASSGSFRIEGCDGLQNLSGLENFNFIGDYFYVINNSQLNDISALSNLSFVGNRVHIANNDNLGNLNGLESLTTAAGIEIISNLNLKNIDGLSNLVSVRDVILIKYNDNLISLNAFQNITTTEYVIIENNASLNSLIGLSNLISVDYNMNIGVNSSLKELDGLENLLKVDGLFQIYNNSSLEEFCAIKPLLSSNNDLNITINNNLNNPSVDEILNSCE
jgi:hypothetical protein